MLAGLMPRQRTERDGPRTHSPDPFLITVKQDRVEPGGESAAFIITPERPPSFHQCFRNQIFRSAAVPAQSNRLLEQTSLQRLQQKAKSFCVSLTRLEEESLQILRFTRVFADAH